MNKCVQCGATELQRSTLVEERVVAGHTFHITLPSTRCASCGEQYIDGAVGERADLLIARTLLDAGIRGGSAIRHARKALGLNGKELAALLGVRAETVSRWESDAIAPPEHAIVSTLAAMVSDALDGRDDTRKRLERYSDAKELPRTFELPMQ